MASPLSIASSLDSIWTASSLPTPPAVPKPPSPIAELLPGWPCSDVEPMATTNATINDTRLVSRTFHDAPAPAIPLSNALPPVASSCQEEAPSSPDLSTPSSIVGSTEYLDDVQGDSLAVACRKLRRRLRAQYANTKPPGDLFGPFIHRLRKQNHCRLCPKVLENREQMNQHIMKDHCEHKPFACPEEGW